MLFPPALVIELRDEDGIADLGGAGAFILRSPSKSIFDDAEGILVAEFEPPVIIWVNAIFIYI